MGKSMVSCRFIRFKPIFNGKNHGFRLRFSPTNQSIEQLVSSNISSNRRPLAALAPPALCSTFCSTKSRASDSACAMISLMVSGVEAIYMDWLISSGYLTIGKWWFNGICYGILWDIPIINGLVCWGKSTGNHGFYQQIGWGFRLKFSHHPILRSNIWLVNTLWLFVT